MAISSVGSNARPGVCTSTTRPTTPFEGQLIYETDTDMLAIWNGSAWRYIGQSSTTADSNLDTVGLWKINTTSVSTQTSLTVDNCFSSAFQNYRLVFSFESTSNTDIRMRLRGGSPAADRTDTEYQTMGLDRSGSGLTTFGGITKTDHFYVSNSGGSTALGFTTIDVFRPNEATRTGTIWTTGFEWISNDLFYRSGTGYFDKADVNTGFKLYSTVSFTGKVTVYGYRD